MAGMQQKLCRIGFAEHFLARRNGVVDRFPLQAHPYPTLTNQAETSRCAIVS